MGSPYASNINHYCNYYTCTRITLILTYTHFGTESINSIMGKPPTSKCGEREEARVIPVPHDPCGDELLNLSFGDNSVMKI